MARRSTGFFDESYKDHDQYPMNLVYRASYRKVLEAYKARLDKASAKLFLKEGNPRVTLDVRFRDFNGRTSRFEEVQPNQVQSLASLKSYLGDASTGQTVRLTRSDPICRYISISSEVNRLPLKISRAMTNLLFSFHQVMPSYLDFVSVFGAQLEQREVRFSGFHQQSTLGVQESKRPTVPSLGRSGHCYQLCYNLKAIVEKSGKGKEKEWSKRQAAIHHQFDVDNGTALWICTEGRTSGGLFDRIRDLTQDDKRRQDWSYGNKMECFRSSLATHLSCCHWSIEEWRSYLGWLEETVEKETGSAIGGLRAHIPGTKRKTYTADDLMLVQGYEDQTNEVMTILEANNDVMKSLSEFYMKLLDNDGFDGHLRTQCKEDTREFAAQISDMIYDANMQIRRASSLVKIAADRKALTFFSTDVVKYQGQDGNGSFSQVALWRWLQVTVPLSGVTLFIGYAWYRYQEAKSKKKGILLPM